MRFLLHNETGDETGWCMLDDLEAADGWAELTYEEQTERIRTAFDAQLERDKAEDPRKALATAGKKCWNVLCKHGDCKTQSRGREDAIGIIRVVDKHGKLVCPLHRCGKHGGRSNGRTKRDELLPSERCTHPGCRAGNHGGTSQIKTPIGGKPNWWRYCTVPHKDADAPRRQLFAAIRDKLGQNDPDVQAKLTKLNTKQQPETPAAALAQLETILAAGTLQAVQDALDAGPSGANAP